MEVIRTFINDHDISPTVLELAGILSISGPTVHEQIHNMVRKGYLRRPPMKTRTIEVVELSASGKPVASLPVLGRVAAGSPILAVENVIGELKVEVHKVRGSCFALEIVGDSMVDADIHEGDYVIVRQQALAENSEIVVALLSDQVTVKTLFINEDQVELRPANSAYKPIRIDPDDEFRILGKVIAVHSKESNET